MEKKKGILLKIYEKILNAKARAKCPRIHATFYRYAAGRRIRIPGPAIFAHRHMPAK